MTTEPQLTAAVGDYPHTKALKDGRVRSDSFSLSFADIPAINRAFAPMAREQRFNVSEMAIATYFQAKAYGKPLVLLPVVLAARFQEGALLCRADSDIEGPASLAGRRVGVRAYGQTTAMWLRGVLSEDFGVPADTIRWVTFEGAHVAEAADPSWAERAIGGRRNDGHAEVRCGRCRDRRQRRSGRSVDPAGVPRHRRPLRSASARGTDSCRSTTC